MKRSEAIRNLLISRTHTDLAILYNAHMEVQVNVGQDGGERIDKDYKGKKYQSYGDGISTWNHFRIPANAKTEPEDNDYDITYDLAAHAEGIGMTGWDWYNRLSCWVAFDFDAVTGHSEKHKKKLSDVELRRIQEAVSALDWVTIRASTSGKGLHLYVFLDNITTNNHTEHAAVARSVLGLMSSLIGFDLESDVDACGSNMWVWHRKMIGTNGLTLVKAGSVLQSVPPNWKDHIKVVNGKAKKIVPAFIEQSEVAGIERMFNELTSAKTQIPLDAEHQKLIKYLHENNLQSYFVDGMLVTHTIHLRTAHDKLGLRGIYKTNSEGTDLNTQNCFAYPSRNGGWVVRRFSKGVGEDPSWTQDPAGWTRCYFNCEPDLATAARSKGAVEQVAGGYSFREAEVAVAAAKELGVDISIPNWASSRLTSLKQHRDGRLIVKIKHEDHDPADQMKGWLPEKGHWTQIFHVQAANVNETEIKNFDETIRHLITENSDDSGWVLKSEDDWRSEPLVHVRSYLKALGFKTTESDNVIGSCVAKPWRLVCWPFQDEEPGNRSWNRNAPQLAYLPSEHDDLSYNHWTMILNHLGEGLNDAIRKNPWAVDNGILTGADYLKVWISSLFKEPRQPLPYLFFFGPQNNGKSIFHESIQLLVTKGVVRADNALTNGSGFNAELENAILAAVEETDLRHNKIAYGRIKDWVTCIEIPIHRKGMTPYSVHNTIKWVHTANDYQACPVTIGDSRIVMIEVKPLTNMIPKKQLIPMLQKEAPDFLAAILRLELPVSNDRLNVPVIETEAKVHAGRCNETALEIFLRDNCHHVTGKSVLLSVFYEKFREFLDPDQLSQWSKQKVIKGLPSHFPKGRSRKNNHVMIGNISFEPKDPAEGIFPVLKVENDILVTTAVYG